VSNMKFYDVAFMEVRDLFMRVGTHQGSNWVAISSGPDAHSRAIVLHLTAGQEERFRRACEAFNAAMAEPVAIAAE